MVWSEAQVDSRLVSLGGREAVGVGGRGKFEKCILAVSEAGLNEDRLPCRGGDGCRGQSVVSKKWDWEPMATGPGLGPLKVFIFAGREVQR